MIAVTRKPTPQSLVNNAATWTADYLAAKAALATDPTSLSLKKLKKQAEEKYRQDDIKEALQAMFHDKCCFCERKRDYPHIEHFNPKDSAPQLCFDWLNLLYACEVCNGATYKGTKFPLAANGTPLFINPCTDNPDEHLDFICEQDAAAEHGFIAILKGKTAKGNTTKDILGLNRINLLKERNHHIAPYYLKLAIMAHEGDQTAKDLLDRACQAHNIYAAFMRRLSATIVGG